MYNNNTMYRKRQMQKYGTIMEIRTLIKTCINGSQTQSTTRNTTEEDFDCGCRLCAPKVKVERRMKREREVGAVIDLTGEDDVEEVLPQQKDNLEEHLLQVEKQLLEQQKQQFAEQMQQKVHEIEQLQMQLQQQQLQLQQQHQKMQQQQNQLNLANVNLVWIWQT
ncbi:uncharacterized protein isoform X2 [Musca autumnalis]